MRRRVTRSKEDKPEGIKQVDGQSEETPTDLRWSKVGHGQSNLVAPRRHTAESFRRRGAAHHLASMR